MKLEKIINQLNIHYSHDNEAGGDLATGLIAQRLGRYRSALLLHQYQVHPDMVLHVLLHDSVYMQGCKSGLLPMQ